MSDHGHTRSMAVFCDFENIAIGSRDAKYQRFEIAPILERLLLRGNIVVRKAYCDWERYKDYKKALHEASFELIEIPHVRMSGKNSADIRMVVDALDLCYTKPHVDTFVIISGDSDFSPLVSKLRENDRVVVGVGVRQSTSDLLTAICDEFIFYDDLVENRKASTTRRRRSGRAKAAAASETPSSEAEDRASEAIDWLMEIVEALFEERGEEDKVWGSMVKQSLKRRRPGFNERAYGFKSFGALLEEAQKRGRLTLVSDGKSGGYIVDDYNDS
ncbi:MAG: NYN domain-containing protein [Gammaproteobacteria bacterium]|nr:NYN domain-containing protein [Gammaproteobacteria bacterium]